MKLEIKDTNYTASVVAIKTLVALPKCDNVCAAMLFGHSVIVGKDTPVGTVGLYFPVETALSKEFLSKNNLYRHQELNADPEKKGYFEDGGRIRAVKFRGYPSDGFFIPIESLDNLNIQLDEPLEIGAEFNLINGVEICRKYIPKSLREKHVPGVKKPKREAVKFSRLVDNQFRLHPDTVQLGKNIHLLHPDDMISLSDKFHGTSFVVGKVLTVRPLPWKDRLAKWLGVLVKEEIYDAVYSSRKVVKGVSYYQHTFQGTCCSLWRRTCSKLLPSAWTAKMRGKEIAYQSLFDKGVGFYGYDLWEDIKNQIIEVIPQGVTVYGEAVGYLNSGKCIQKGYHYGAKPNQFDIYVYRVTFTNPQGMVFEFSWPQMKEFCESRGLNMVREFFYGYAKDAFPDLEISLQNSGENWLEVWQEGFLNRLLACKAWNMGDVMCKTNNFEVPAEGTVLRKDFLHRSEAFKCKNWNFLTWETKQLDAGEVDIESDQAEEE